MRLTYFGGPAWDAGPLPARGRGQEALLFRLALDAGTVVGVRALAEDIWPLDPPADPRAALQSLVSRLRRAVGTDLIQAVSGGYRLRLSREEIDLTRFQDLVAAARASASAATAQRALALWSGDPWVPEGFDWAVRDLWEDRAHAERLAAASDAGAPTSTPAAPADARDDAGGTGGSPRPDGATWPDGPDGSPSQARAMAPAATVLPATVPATTVPAALTPLIGRGDELAEIARRLQANRLVTLIGPGGAGKTTLARESARHAGDVVFVELAPASPAEVWASVAGAVGRSIRLAESSLGAENDRTRVIDALTGRAVLLVLDNCEHVSAAAAELAIGLLTAVPDARILTTSREPLGVPGEAFVDLGPLPEADATLLFARRVDAVRGRAPAADETDTVARIVRRLDGLPLALELAAAKARTLTLAEIDDGLDDRFALLATGPRAADPRHQTLRALIDWSWETLSAPERTALLAASVFADGIGVGDAPAVADAFETDAGAFDHLVDRSLLRRAEGRFRMLETVREYGLDRLRAADDEQDARLRTAGVLARLAAAQDRRLRGPEVRDALAWFDANDESLAAAARLTQSDPALRELGLQLFRATLWAWAMRERFDELHAGVTALARDDDPLESEPAVVVCAIGALLPAFAAAASGTLPDPGTVAAFRARADAVAAAARRHPSELSLAIAPLMVSAARAFASPDLHSARAWGFDVADADVDGAPPWTVALLGVLRAAYAQNSGDVDTLGHASERALAMFRDLGDVWGVALAGQMRSEWLMLNGRLEEALEISDLSTEGLTGLTSVWDVIQQRSQAIGILARLGRLDEAEERLEDVRRQAEGEGSARSLLQYHFTAASVAVVAGDPEATLRHLDTVRMDVVGGPERQLQAWAAAKRAHALLALGRADEARETLRTALPTAVQTGDQPIIAELVMAVAAWLADAGQTDAARRAFAASVRIRGRADETDPLFARLRDRLGAPGDAREGDDDPSVIVALLE